jgi:tetratricopeptide (TPR) repeat protein
MAPLAKSAAEKAVLLDPENSEAHSVLGAMAGADDYDWNLSQTHFRQALAAETVPPMVRYRYVMYYLWPLGRFPEAIEQSRLALETDPLSAVLHQCMASSMNNAKQYREAIEYSTKALEIDSNFFLMWATLGIAQLSAGLAQEAIASLKKCVALAPWWRVGMGLLAAVCLQAGDLEASREWAGTLAAPPSSPTGRAIWYAATKEVDAMFGALDVACRQRDATLLLFQNLPFFDAYRADPRFQTLLAKMNLA